MGEPSSALHGTAVVAGVALTTHTGIGPRQCWARALQLQASLQVPVASVHPDPAQILSISTAGLSARSPGESKTPSGFGLKAQGRIYHPRMSNVLVK